MNLIFKSSEILNRSKGITFDDVLLVPRHSEISSRNIPNLSTQVTKNYRLEIPLISANMDTVTGKEMVMKMGTLGGMGILHRFMTLEEQAKDIGEIRSFFKKIKSHCQLQLQ